MAAISQISSYVARCLCVQVGRQCESSKLASQEYRIYLRDESGKDGAWKSGTGKVVRDAPPYPAIVWRDSSGTSHRLC
jgi:hypothetical protein